MSTRRVFRAGLAIWVAQAAAVLGYLKVLRPRLLTWGSTEADVARPLPGDEVVPEPALTTTHAVTIDVPPDQVWPWLVQMGPGRGGAYTYDWVENLFGLNMHSADRIHPEWLDMKVGDAFQLGKDGPPLRVEALEAERTLLLALPDRTWSWVFFLEPIDGERTRLIERNRFPIRRFKDRLKLELLLPGAFLMERKMLLGIKKRAERLVEDRRRADDRAGARRAA